MRGTLLKSTYRILSELGKGGMGTVYLAEHKTLLRKFAVKFLNIKEDASAETLRRFQDEAMIASGLGHPNIVEVLDFDWHPDGTPFIVMELLDGEDLASRRQRLGRMSPAVLAPIARQICSGLAAAHQAGIVAVEHPRVRGPRRPRPSPGRSAPGWWRPTRRGSWLWNTLESVVPYAPNLVEELARELLAADEVYADYLQLVRAVALRFLGREQEAGRLLRTVVEAAPKGHREGLRSSYDRHQTIFGAVARGYRAPGAR
jgi:hypothetical protein